MKIEILTNRLNSHKAGDIVEINDPETKRKMEILIENGEAEVFTEKKPEVKKEVKKVLKKGKK